MFQNKLFIRTFSLVALIGTGTIVFTIGKNVKQAIAYSAVSKEIEAIQHCSMFEIDLPENTVLYGLKTNIGRFLPYPIDKSNEPAKVFNVVVNSPQQPVVLFLGTEERAVWDIQWTEGTNILGVVAFGLVTQAVAGLPKSTPVVINAQDDCGQENSIYNRIARGIITADLKWNRVSFETLSTNLFGQPHNEHSAYDPYNDTSAYNGEENIYYFGEPPAEDTKLLSSEDVTVESFMNYSE